MSKTSDILYLAALLLIKSCLARPFSKEEFRNAILKNTESRWIEEIFDNDTDFETEEPNQVAGHFLSNRNLVKSLKEDYDEDYDYYYTYEEDPIIEIRFRRNVENESTQSEKNKISSSTESPIAASSPSPLSNAFPKPLNMRRRNRRLKKNLRKNRRLRKTLKRDQQFTSNRT